MKNFLKIKYKYIIEQLKNENLIHFTAASYYSIKENADIFCGYCIFKNNLYFYLKDNICQTYDLFGIANKRYNLKDISKLKKFNFKTFKQINNLIFKIKLFFFKIFYKGEIFK